MSNKRPLVPPYGFDCVLDVPMYKRSLFDRHPPLRQYFKIPGISKTKTNYSIYSGPILIRKSLRIESWRLKKHIDLNGNDFCLLFIYCGDMFAECILVVWSLFVGWFQLCD